MEDQTELAALRASVEQQARLLRAILVMACAIALVLVTSLLTVARMQPAFADAIASLVKITNTDAEPVPVRSVDVTSVEPFQFRFDTPAIPGNLPARRSFSVPAGKRLVIEYISAQPGDHQRYKVNIITTVNGVRGIYFFPVKQISDGHSLYLVSKATRVYADPETTVEIVADPLTRRNSSLIVTISGYLVPVS